MELPLTSRLKHAWNAFLNRDPTFNYQNIGTSYSYRPDRFRLTRGNERSIVTSVYNRIALDVAAINIQHVQLDKEGRFLNVIPSDLNNCLSLQANLDQTGRAFIQDIVMSMMDEGCVAVVPVDTDDDPDETTGYKILSMRVGRILDWYPRHVRVRAYNENTGRNQDIIVPKELVAIIENPLYAVINEPNSTMQRLIRKLNLLDAVDEQSSSGKLDLIIQLPFVVKTEARRQQAEQRRKDIERQLSGSKYGIAYTDATEHITQLNRSLENNLMKQIEYLTSMLYSQLGITQSILDGTADEKTMLNYYNRTIEPIISAIADEMKRKFLTKTARSQNKSIMFFRDPFKLVPVADLAEISDKFTRNEIATSNEIRQVIGWKPSEDPKADELRNSNLSNPSVADGSTVDIGDDGEIDQSGTADYDEIVNNLLDELTGQIDAIIGNYSPDNDDDEEDEVKTAELRHYASQYYDPVKAHEYYMRTRELKGRSTSSLNDEGKKVWSYAKNNIKSEKAAKVKAEQEKRALKIKQLRAKAEATREQISSKLKTLNNKLSEDAAAEKKDIDDEKNSDLEIIETDSSNKKEQIDAQKEAAIKQLKAIEIPSGLSKEERAKRVAERNEKIAKIRGDAKSDKAKISNQAKSDKSDVRSNASAQKTEVSNQTKQSKAVNTSNAKSERARVSAELKSAVEAARKSYAAAKENLNTSYEKIYQQEFDKIASEYKAVKKTSKKSSKKKSSKTSTKKKSHPLSYYIRE